MTKILDGKLLADEKLAKLKTKIAASQVKPGLAVVLVGDDSSSHLYVGLKEEACQQIGMYFEKHLFNRDTEEKEVIKKIKDLNKKEDIHGIIVQLPLPPHLNESKIIKAISPKKDADGFHPKSAKRWQRSKTEIVSPLLQTIETFLQQIGEDLNGAQAVILGNSEVFVQNTTTSLTKFGIKSKHFHKIDDHSTKYLREADVIIIALGQPKCLTGEMIQKGAIIIDVGITKIAGLAVGDVNQDSVMGTAGYLTPVPGGVGPMTVAMLLENTHKLAQE